MALLAKHHGTSIDPGDVDELVASISRELNWMESVTSARPTLEELREKVDSFLEVTTDRQSASHIRMAALGKGSDDADLGSAALNDAVESSGLDFNIEKFLDVEIVAIYW